ncbi:MAG TPA: ATP-binding protein [Actinomycetes bacterium]
MSDDLGRLRAQLSSLQSLLTLSRIMGDSGDERRIAELAGSAVPSLSCCRLVGIRLADGGWALLGPAAPPELGLGDLTDVVDRLGLRGGAVTLPVSGAGWVRAYPMASSAGHAGVLVVAAAVEPPAEERFVLQALAQQTGVAMVNARLQADERAAAMRALRRHSEALEAANADLGRSNRTLAETNAELERLAYVTSHHLSEPLRSITGFAQLLERGYRHRLDARADEAIGFIVDGVARMHATLQGVVAYYEAGQAPLRRCPVDAHALVEQAAAALAPTIAATGATVACDPLPRLDADPDQLGLVLRTLVANALKFRGEAAPRIHVGATREPDGWRLSVADNGVGVEPAHRERIFRMFHRAHGHGGHPGSGVSLAICLRVVQRHGGRIWVEPHPEGGSVFHLTVPDRQHAGGSKASVQEPLPLLPGARRS